MAGFVCGGFMFKYFLGHTEVNWTKKNRMTHDNQGIDDAKVASHNSRFGMRKMNKHQVKVFPFNFIPMDSAQTALRTRPAAVQSGRGAEAREAKRISQTKTRESVQPYSRDARHRASS